MVRMINMLSKTMKGHVVAAAGEFAGTFLFLLFGMGALNAVNDAPMVGENDAHSLSADTSKLLFISLAFGFSLAINVWVFFRISGGLFNPAVTLGLFLIGKVKAVRAIVIFFAQIVGAIAASAVVYGLTPGPLMTRTQLGPDVSIVQGLFIEVQVHLLQSYEESILIIADVPHSRACIHHLHVGSGETYSQLHRTHRYRTSSVRRPAFRHVLYRLLAQSSSILWSRRCSWKVRWVSLDLLGKFDNAHITRRTWLILHSSVLPWVHYSLLGSISSSKLSNTKQSTWRRVKKRTVALSEISAPEKRSRPWQVGRSLAAVMKQRWETCPRTSPLQI